MSRDIGDTVDLSNMSHLCADLNYLRMTILNKEVGVTCLDLSFNMLGNASAESIYDTLLSCTSLTMLSLASNLLGSEGFQSLTKLSCHSSIRDLDLRSNTLSWRGLGKCFGSNRCLSSLNLSRNILTSIGAKEIAIVLKDNRTLTKLDISNNFIGSDGAKSLSDALVGNRTLKHLDLSSNDLGSEGSCAIALALKSNSTLTFLSVKENMLGPDGAKAFGKFLSENCSIEILDLSFNFFDTEDIEHLKQGAKTNGSVKALKIDESDTTVFDICERNISCKKKAYKAALTFLAIRSFKKPVEMWAQPKEISRLLAWFLYMTKQDFKSWFTVRSWFTFI